MFFWAADCALPHCAYCSGMVWRPWWLVQGVALVSKFPRCQSSWASVGHVELSFIHDDPALKPKVTAKILVPKTTGHHRGSCKVHASAGGCCFGSTQKSSSILDRWSCCFGSSVYSIVYTTKATLIISKQYMGTEISLFLFILFFWGGSNAVITDHFVRCIHNTMLPVLS